MLIVLTSDASLSDRDRVVALIESLGYRAQVIEGHQRTFVAVVDNDGRVDGARFTALPGVEEIVHVTRPYRMVAREWRTEPTIVGAPGRPQRGRGRARWRARPRSSRRRGRSSRPERPRCAPAPSSRGPRPTPSRDWVPGGSSCSPPPGPRPAC